MGKATSTRISSTMPSTPCPACPLRSRTGTTIFRPIAAWRRGLRNGWKRSEKRERVTGSVRASQHTRELLVRGHGDFDASGADQLGHSNRRAYGARLFKVCRIDGVHALEQRHVRKVNINGDGILKSHAGLFQDEPDVLQALLDFSFKLGRN